MNSIFILAGVCLAGLIGWLLLIKLRMPLTRTIVLLAAFFGVASNIIMLPGIIPDEMAHMQTAYRYANVFLLMPYETEGEEMLVRKADYPFDNLPLSPRATAYALIAKEWRFFAGGDELEMVSQEGRSVRTGFIAYLPSAIGIALARILHFGKWPMIYFARLCNLAFFIGLLVWAVKVTPVKKHLFAIIGLIPAVSQAAGSMSYDAPMIGLGLLVTAYILHLIFVAKRIGWREWVLCSIAAFLLFPCKFIYSSIFLLLLFIPHTHFKHKRTKVLFLCCVVVAGTAGFLSANIFHIVKQMNTLPVDYRPNSINQKDVYSLGWLLRHPGEVPRMVLQSFRDYADTYWKGMFGGRLNRSDNTLNWTLVWMACYVILSMRDGEDSIQPTINQRLVSGGAFGLSVLASFIIMIIDYTPVGSRAAVGVQGRYFLPLLPLLSISIGSKNITINDDAKRWITVLLVACNTGALLDLLRWLLQN